MSNFLHPGKRKKSNKKYQLHEFFPEVDDELQFFEDFSRWQYYHIFIAFWPIASYTFLYRVYSYKKTYGVIAVALFQPFSINNALLLIDLLLDIFKLFLHFAILNHTGEIRIIHHKQHVLSSTASSSSILMITLLTFSDVYGVYEIHCYCHPPHQGLQDNKHISISFIFV